MTFRFLSGDGPCRQLMLLTKRQRQVLQMLRTGQPNKEIAYSLGVSESTVKGHVASLLKMGFGNRVQLAVFANKNPKVLVPGNLFDVPRQEKLAA